MNDSKYFSSKIRPRRLRTSSATRDLATETRLHPKNLVWPVFILEGEKQIQPVASMPGVNKLSLDLVLKEAKEAEQLGISALALFPVIPDAKKDKKASESKNSNSLMQVAIRELKKELPNMVLFTDVAMDPYSTDGHDGLVKDGKILNDETLPILAEMAIAQAKAGADFISPSDMMDHRVGFIRQALDAHGFTDTGIMSYAAKYASAFYGPFRDALDSAPNGDKKTYQMNPANKKEALREVLLDIDEGADMVMVKPALAYLDIIHLIKSQVNIPVTAYNVSGEYAMLKLLGKNKLCDEKAVILESLTSIKRAGADLIFTYFAKDVAPWL